MKRIAVSPIDWRFLLRAALLLVVYSFLFVFFNTTDDFTSFEMLSLMTVGVSLCALAWLWLGQRAPMPLSKPLLIYITAYWVTSFTSTDPRRSLGDFGFLLFALFLFSLSADLVAWGWPAGAMARVWMVGGGMVALFLWAQVWVWFQQWQAASAGSQFTSMVYRLPVPNLIAIFLNPFILAAVAFFLAARKWQERATMVLVGLLFAGLSYLASSRAAWLGIAAGLFFLILWFVRERKPNWRAAWGWLGARPVLTLVLGVILLVGLAAGGWLLYQQTIHPTHAAIGDAREEYWGPAWQAFLRSPLVGHGPYTFGSIWLQTYSVPPYGFFPHAHSTLLNLLAEGGIVLTLALLWLLWSALRLLWRRLWTAEGTQRPVVAAALASLLAFTVQGFFDSYHHEPLGLWAFLLLLGLALGKPAAAQPLTSRWRRMLRSGQTGLVLTLLAALWLNLWALAPYAQGQQLADSGKWLQAAPLLQESARRDPWLAATWAQAGLAQANSGNPDLALEDLKKAAELDPDWSLNWANLGAVYLAQGEITSARQAFERAAAQDPGMAEFWLGLGQAAEADGDVQAAFEAYRSALNLRPDWAGAYFWRAGQVRHEAYLAWQSSVKETPALTLDQLKTAMEANPSLASPYMRLGEMYLQAGQVEDAQRILRKADLAYFSDTREQIELLWLHAEVAAFKNDLPLAVGYAEQALGRLMNPGLFGPDAPGGTVYYPIAFRRPAIRSDFVAQYHLIFLTDSWGERMVQLAQWHATLGQPERAQEINSLIMKEIPDHSSLP